MRRTDKLVWRIEGEILDDDNDEWKQRESKLMKEDKDAFKEMQAAIATVRTRQGLRKRYTFVGLTPFDGGLSINVLKKRLVIFSVENGFLPQRVLELKND